MIFAPDHIDDKKCYMDASVSKITHIILDKKPSSLSIDIYISVLSLKNSFEMPQ